MNVRLLPFAVAGGPAHMAADETLLEAAAAGVASLRLYAWSPATLSLGYFQPAAGRLADERLARMPWVRRPSGGGAIVHDYEVTYCLALPAGPPWQTGTSWLVRMHEVIAVALADLGVTATPHAPTEQAAAFDGYLCFEHFTAGDLMVGGFKVVGSAQRRLRKALLQHGSILLAASPHAPGLPGIRDLSGRDLAPDALGTAVQQALVRKTGWRLAAGVWTEAERRRKEELARDKYTRQSWNDRR
jgi:lipoate-protein ligase A